MRGIWAALSVVVLAGCGPGCRKNESKAGVVDAGVAVTDAAPAIDAGPAGLEAHAVARVTSYNARLVASPAGRVLLDAGTLVFEIEAGVPKLLGDRVAYAALFRADREGSEAIDLGGYDSASTLYRRLFFDDKQEIIATNGQVGFRWSGTAWQKLDPAPPMKDDDGMYNGTLPPALQGHDDSRCTRGRSYGGTSEVFLCHSWREKRSTTVWRHRPDEWKPFVLGDKDDEVDSLAVDKDDRVWMGIRGGGILRLDHDALELEKGVKISLTDAPASLVRASYDVEEMGSVRSGDPDAPQLGAMRYFSAVRLREGDPQSPVSGVDHIVPLPSGEAYVLARESHGPRVLIHLRRPKADRVDGPPLYVGTDADQRVEIMNAKPTRGWIGRCPHVLVIAAREKPDGSLSADPLFAREKELTDAVQASTKKAKPTKPGGQAIPPTVAIVEGRSGGKRIAGVLVVRAYPDVSEELVDKIATEMGARFTPNPASPAEATCTPPVLDRVKVLPRAAVDD